MKKVVVFAIVFSVILISAYQFFNIAERHSDGPQDLEVRHMPNAELELQQTKVDATGESRQVTGSSVFISIDDIEKTVDSAAELAGQMGRGSSAQEENVSYELVSWSEDYKKELFLIVDENMPQHSADFMKLQINKNSSHINNNELKQDPAIDENWAYIMEQDIRSLINQHQLKAEFDILSVTCKQLSCEILGIEYTAQSWQKIYVSLLTALPNVVFPDVGGAAPTFSINEGARDLVFGRISFKKS
ncbi:hypothetical protein SAMN06297280_1446 [Arsukibacterium tuosuense]|uniref:Uncharacterized protein n=1 Tax=Arsukibacterium tuosuense TaxID=1323745 RepID=A0A285INE4_9GAMM|nr:hypothetical protein [Arsukibacterium tuosuense]SNY49520.1 hypothetical protein SAMN06297280_1446 [Arsukibacterium tuosuense]